VARVLIAVGGVLLVLGIVLGGYQVYLRYQDAIERQQVDRYTAAIQPGASDAGRLVQETIIPEIDAYAAGTLPAGKIALDAASWRVFFQRTRQQFAAAAHPGDLDSVARQFDAALGEYEASVSEIQKVVAADAAQTLAAAKAQAKRGDCDYGRAAVALTSLRRSLSLPDVATFAAANTNACR